MRPATIAEVARRLFDVPAQPLWKPLGEFLDEFYEPESDNAAMLIEEPCAEIPHTYLAYLAAAAEHLSSLYRLSAPDWVTKPAYFLDQAFYDCDLGPRVETMLIAESPISFRRRFIFTEAEPLRRKRGPAPVA